MAQAWGRKLDLVVTDMKMAPIGGPELTELLFERRCALSLERTPSSSWAQLTAEPSARRRACALPQEVLLG